MNFKVLEKQLVFLSRLNIWVTSLFILLIYLANLFFIDDANVNFSVALNNHKFNGCSLFFCFAFLVSFSFNSKSVLLFPFFCS